MMPARSLLAGLTPFLLWLALPGGGEIWPLLFIALVPFLLFLPGLTVKQAVFGSFVCGLVYHGLQLYWLVNVLTQFGGLPVFIAVPALFLLVAYMAFYFIAKGLTCRLLLRDFPPVAALLGVPLVWVGFDWLRSVLFSGFPWLDLGYGLAGVPVMIQSAELFGHSGLTFMVVLVNALFVLVWQGVREHRFPVVPVVLTLALTTAVSIYSVMSLSVTEMDMKESGRKWMRIGIVQGNIDQSLKWSEKLQEETVDTYLSQTKMLVQRGQAELVVWPETALPFYPRSYPGMGGVFSQLADNKVPVLTGVPWYEIIDLEKKQIDYFNSAQLLLPDGTFGDSYYKSHLVPFGEYIPLKRFLPFLSPLVEAVGDFSPGTVENPLVYKGAKLGVLICFESIFPDIARKWVESGANILVNLTNDAWYGRSGAPYHSMAMSVFRAVETRRWVVRSANTGISGFIDPTGQVVKPSEIFTDWAEVAFVQFNEKKTVFVRWGYLFAPACFVLTGILLIWSRKMRGREI